MPLEHTTGDTITIPYHKPPGATPDNQALNDHFHKHISVQPRPRCCMHVHDGAMAGMPVASIHARRHAAATGGRLAAPVKRCAMWAIRRRDMGGEECTFLVLRAITSFTRRVAVASQWHLAGVPGEGFSTQVHHTITTHVMSALPVLEMKSIIQIHPSWF